MTFGDLVREYFPKANDDFVEYVLWNQTAFPATSDEKHLRKQIERFKKAIELKRVICDGCGKIRHKSQMHNRVDICKWCIKRLARKMKKTSQPIK